MRRTPTTSARRTRRTALGGPAAPAVATAATLAALLALAACSGGKDDSARVAAPATTASPGPASTATSPEPTETAETAATPVEAGTRVEPTAPGTFLAATDPAVIEVHVGFDAANDHYVEAQFTSRLVSVTPADPADFTGVDLDEPLDPATETAYYVRTAHRLDWVKTTSVVAVYPPHINGWDSGGAGASDLLVFGVFDPCTSGTFDDLVPGAEVEACDIAVLPVGTPLAWVGVAENPQISRDAREEYEAVPVAWSVG